MNGRVLAPAVLWLAFATSSGPPARAEPGVSTCVLSGTAQPRVNTNIHDAQGRVIARFSGSAVALSVRDFPADGAGRVRIETGNGSGSFRVRGFARAHELPLYALSAIPVIAQNVFIAPGRSLTLVASAPGKLRVAKHVTAPLLQSFSAWAPCSAVGLGPPSANGEAPRDEAHAYLLKRARLELFDSPGGSLLTTLLRSPESESVVFYGGERSGAWLRVSHHSDVLVEAWARAKELAPLQPGETAEPSPRVTWRGPARLAVHGEPRIVTPERDVPLRASTRDQEPPIGVIERATETYVLDVVAGWASVMPKALNVVPAPDRQFWVKTADLGI